MSGRAYAFDAGAHPDDGTRIVDAPPWLVALAAQAERPTGDFEPPPPCSVPLEERQRRAVAYLAKMSAAISGKGGHVATWKAALVVVRGFHLPGDDGLAILRDHFNPRCVPPWEARDLLHKVEDVHRKSPFRWGFKLDERRNDRRGADEQPTNATGAPRNEGAERDARRVSRESLTRGDHAELAELLLSELETTAEPLVYANGALHRYEPTAGTWQTVPPHVESKAIQGFAGLAYRTESRTTTIRIKANDVKGISRLAYDRAAEPDFFVRREEGIAFANGFLRVAAGELTLVPHAARHRADVALPMTYDPASPRQRWLSFLSEVFRDDEDRDEKIRLLQQFTGACLLGIAPRYQKAIVNEGGGANGKSVFLAVISALFPDHARATIAPHRWGDDKYRAELVGVRLNAVSELPEADLLESEPFKAIITGEEIEARRAYGHPMKFRPVAGHVFAANQLPVTNDLTDGFWRRLVVVRFNRTFREDEQDRDLASRIIADELPGVVAWAVDGARDLLTFGRYAIPRSSELAVAEWKHASDNVAAFVAESCEPTSHSPFESTLATKLYQAYQAWCPANGLKPLGSRKFAGRMKALGYESSATNVGRAYPVRLRGRGCSDASGATSEHRSE